MTRRRALLIGSRIGALCTGRRAGRFALLSPSWIESAFGWDPDHGTELQNAAFAASFAAKGRPVRIDGPAALHQLEAAATHRLNLNIIGTASRRASTERAHSGVVVASVFVPAGEVDDDVGGGERREADSAVWR